MQPVARATVAVVGSHACYGRGGIPFFGYFFCNDGAPNKPKIVRNFGPFFLVFSIVMMVLAVYLGHGIFHPRYLKNSFIYSTKIRCFLGEVLLSSKTEG